MEPLKPEVKKRILADRPQAAPQDIEEYERLLAERFMSDPNAPTASALPPGAPQAIYRGERPCDAHVREARLRELHEKLFGEVVAAQEEKKTPSTAARKSRKGTKKRGK